MIGRKTSQQAVEAAGKLDLLQASRMSGSGLPQAPVSAFRKRPVKLSYDKNEYWMFRLPSENHYLMQQFDKTELFGTRHGIQHSPAMLAQTQLDNKLLIGLAGVFVLMMLGEFRRNGTFQPLRENFRSSDMGRFSKEDFVEKRQ